MEVGTRVKVVTSVVVYNHPEHRNQPFDMKGQEGEVVSLANEYQGKPISANFPYLVKFAPRHKIHLEDSEIEAI
ncbi:ferredoxin-thioredoxin reductase variable chain [filamentous cyanobacterium LEGE 11480]|uniref:Ferredoxin-thioredoxin reductase variable chain n=2 Tax=Romeriopsis TaxID=2992131 RepID=A0A928Z5E2_9CYAN|nr:ferredoxin-thioredoxin reductase variable chain [Romeriopsis navalis LEGE 11480]